MPSWCVPALVVGLRPHPAPTRSGEDRHANPTSTPEMEHSGRTRLSTNQARFRLEPPFNREVLCLSSAAATAYGPRTTDPPLPSWSVSQSLIGLPTRPPAPPARYARHPAARGAVAPTHEGRNAPMKGAMPPGDPPSRGAGEGATLPVIAKRSTSLLAHSSHSPYSPCDRAARSGVCCVAGRAGILRDGAAIGPRRSASLHSEAAYFPFCSAIRRCAQCRCLRGAYPGEGGSFCCAGTRC